MTVFEMALKAKEIGIEHFVISSLTGNTFARVSNIEPLKSSIYSIVQVKQYYIGTYKTLTVYGYTRTIENSITMYI